MKGKQVLFSLAISMVLFIFIIGMAIADTPKGTSLGNGFTYQGQLKSSDTPYTGSCDFTFKLYDSETSGTLIGNQSKPNVTVSQGYFSVLLDYGAGAFNGDNRWLEIAVGCPTGTTTTILTPRQILTATPYALYALNVKPAWGLTGNAGTTAGTNFLGTSDNSALEVKVNNSRVMRFEPNSTSPNLIGGYSSNWILPDIHGATISGGGMFGYENRVTDNFGTVSGGGMNQAGNNFGDLEDSMGATVGGGAQNSANGQFSVISGGVSNIAENAAVVSGGISNNAHGLASVISGGETNLTFSQYATVSGGYYNRAMSDYSTINGGSSNYSAANGAVISGGKSNTINGPLSAIGGGETNTANADFSTISGGSTNLVSDSYGFVGGGLGNIAGDNAGTYADNMYATVSGGRANTASGEYSTIPGGAENIASGDYSFAAGRFARAFNTGCFIWGDASPVNVTCDVTNQWVARASGGVYFYTNASETAGSYLSAGGSSWNAVSNRELKENFSFIDKKLLLERLSQMEILMWNYKSQTNDILHIGPMSDEFNDLVDGLGGEGRDYINSMDADGVALAAIQGLYEENQELKAKVDDLEARLSALEQGGLSENTRSYSQNQISFPWVMLFGFSLVGSVLIFRRRSGGDK